MAWKIRVRENAKRHVRYQQKCTFELIISPFHYFTLALRSIIGDF